MNLPVACRCSDKSDDSTGWGHSYMYHIVSLYQDLQFRYLCNSMSMDILVRISAFVDWSWLHTNSFGSMSVQIPMHSPSLVLLTNSYFQGLRLVVSYINDVAPMADGPSPLYFSLTDVVSPQPASGIFWHFFCDPFIIYIYSVYSVYMVNIWLINIYLQKWSNLTVRQYWCRDIDD